MISITNFILQIDLDLSGALLSNEQAIYHMNITDTYIQNSDRMYSKIVAPNGSSIRKLKITPNTAYADTTLLIFSRNGIFAISITGAGLTTPHFYTVTENVVVNSAQQVPYVLTFTEDHLTVYITFNIWEEATILIRCNNSINLEMIDIDDE